MTQNNIKRQVVNQLKDRLEQNTGEVLQELKTVFQNNTESLNDVVMSFNKYNRLSRERHDDLASYSDYNREIGKINRALLALIDTISEEEAQAYQLTNAFFQQILVVSLNGERSKAMRELLPEPFYQNVKCIVKDQLPEEKINEYQLLVFDDMQTNEDYYALYEKCLQEAEPYILYFGKKRVSDTNNQGELKAYFANSVFSFHSRLQEMFVYLKYQPTKNQSP